MVDTQRVDPGIQLDNLSRLSFHNDHFVYRRQSYPYSAIEHVNYLAVQTRHSINLVPVGSTYNADLKLELTNQRSLQIAQESRLFRQKDCYIAVARAAAVFSSVTFAQRIAAYERFFAAKGHVSWGDYQIASDGDVFHKYERVFNLRAGSHTLNLAPFSMLARKKQKTTLERIRASWSGEHAVPISRDRDCFLYIMKHRFGIGWEGEEVQKKRFEQDPRRAEPSEICPEAPRDSRERYLRILGLDSRASIEQVKATYREIVKNYHPDALRTRGASVEDMNTAQDYLKVVNHAYSWLMTHDGDR